MPPQNSQKRRPAGLRLSSSSLMDLTSSSEEDDVTTAKAANGNGSASEDGEIEEHTAQPDTVGTEPTRTGGNAEMDALIEAGLSSGEQQIKQKDARYFMMDNVVCAHCGVKGHISFHCKEKAESARCFLCGRTGHTSKECPDDICYYCRKTGHKARDCPEKAGGRGVRKRRGQLRAVRPPRPPKLRCYVCGKDGHLDCGLAKIKSGVLSCYNCGMTGHAGGGCHMTSVDRVIPIVLEMERERKQRRAAARTTPKKGGKSDSESEKGDKKGSADDSEVRKMSPKEYREAFLERARQRRYGRGDR